MAKCNACGLDMLTATGCTTDTVEFPDGSTMPAVPCDMRPGFCRDCNAAPGQLHHPRCCCERCPKCGGQLAFCDCAATKSHPSRVLH